MSGLKELKKRITSIAATSKMTRAMRMIAASKLKKSETAVKNARPFAYHTKKLLMQLSKDQDFQEREILSGIFSLEQETVASGARAPKTQIFVVVTSSKGLCGGLNTYALRLVKEELHKSKAQGYVTHFICVGKKGFDNLNRSSADVHIDDYFDFSKEKKLDFSHAQDIATALFHAYKKHAAQRVVLFYPSFGSAISQKPKKEVLLPLGESFLETEDMTLPREQEFAQHVEHFVFDQEPNVEKLAPYLVTSFLESKLFLALLEEDASENAARMLAMDNATRNAGDMVKRLSLDYNRKRQAAITTTLIEIIAGAESL